MRGLFSDPDLLLQDFGGIQGGSFRFSKGNVADFTTRISPVERRRRSMSPRRVR